ncbi:MerR family transcriptional regulator [Ornithinibacillus halotolerans]|uniref:MerR family transcriptional regulator n=1 Tax=Ornithinibacillus halotolerans TaxID=1274357 RepID=A0A916S6C5_9BACI|nr:MerR family transcriptional regulator [Ornithinibacillus halotolerans]GGA83163.1 MerR family transcriptional regulator [Ornithinibacillus halotolerans]
MLTIQEFSKRTGIPKSALRFYEEKKLLMPLRNKANGYRMYHEDQLEYAKLVSSLRLADVPIKDIQTYFSQSKEEQKTIIKEWIKRFHNQKEILEVQIKFLESQLEDDSVFLFERQKERVIWHLAEGDQGGFGKQLLQGNTLLQKNNINVNNHYIQYISGRKNAKVWIGFGVDEKADISDLEFIDKEEELSKSLCIATQFEGDFSRIETAYISLANYIRNNNYIRTGELIEMYHGNDLKRVTIMVPVLKLGEEEE